MRYLKARENEIRPSMCNAADTPREGEGKRCRGWRAMRRWEGDGMAVGFTTGRDVQEREAMFIFLVSLSIQTTGKF